MRPLRFACLLVIFISTMVLAQVDSCPAGTSPPGFTDGKPLSIPFAAICILKTPAKGQCPVGFLAGESCYAELTKCPDGYTLGRTLVWTKGGLSFSTFKMCYTPDEATLHQRAERVAEEVEKGHPSTPEGQRLQLIEVALEKDEKIACADSTMLNCRREFLKSIKSKPVVLSPSGKRGLIVELSLPGFCGSGGCRIYVLRRESEGGYGKVFEEVGSLGQFIMTRTVTNGFYDLTEETERHSETSSANTPWTYVWTGSKYVVKSTPEQEAAEEKLREQEQERKAARAKVDPRAIEKEKARAAFQALGLHKGQSQTEVKKILVGLGFRNPFMYADNPVWGCNGRWNNGRFITQCLCERKDKDMILSIFEIGQRVRDSDTGGIVEVRTDKLIMAQYTLYVGGPEGANQVTYNFGFPPDEEFPRP